MVALTRTPEQTQAQTLYKLTHAFDMALHKLIPLHADSDELPPFLLADEEQIEAYDVYKTDYENVRAELFRISNPDLCREGS